MLTRPALFNIRKNIEWSNLAHLNVSYLFIVTKLLHAVSCVLLSTTASSSCICGKRAENNLKKTSNRYIEVFLLEYGAIAVSDKENLVLQLERRVS